MLVYSALLSLNQQFAVLQWLAKLQHRTPFPPQFVLTILLIFQVLSILVLVSSIVFKDTVTSFLKLHPNLKELRLFFFSNAEANGA
jgi:hypothetical protein